MITFVYVRMARVCAIVASVLKLPFFFAPAGALAQVTTTGAVMGPVSIPSHATVPNATVTFENVDLRAAQTALPDANSTFRYAFHKPSNYMVDEVTPGPEGAVGQPAGMEVGTGNFNGSMNYLNQGGMER